jgi:predicted dehydrogenase
LPRLPAGGVCVPLFLLPCGDVPSRINSTSANSPFYSQELHMSFGNMSRRGFIARSLAGMAASGLPLWYAKDTLAHHFEQQAQPQGDEIVMGAIGTGPQGRGIMMAARGQPRVRFVAVCDVDRGRRQQAATQLGGQIQQYNDYRELLARRDINAVTIGTVDHWHAQIAIAAMRAGKDVYCEKPLTLTIEESKAVARVSQATGKILQTGSQQRSDARFRLACQCVRNGRLGALHTIRAETRIGDNPVGGPFAVAPVPDGLDWNFWMGPTPQVEYIPQKCHYTFRWWYEYSGGKMTDWGAHHNDIAQWALGMDASGPNVIEGTGDAPAMGNNRYNCHPHFTATYTYNNGPQGAAGAQVRCTDRGENGVHFEGPNGWIFVSRGRIAASAPALIAEQLRQGETALPVSTNHMANFIQCVRNRQQPICNAAIGHRSVTVCHLGNIAIRTGQRVRWNPMTEQVIDNAQLATWLSRPRRAPWTLPE